VFNLNSATAINTIRDTLRTYLTDPYVTAGGDTRDGSTWIFADEPSVSPKYPKISILKVSNPSVPIDIGPAYTEHEQLILNIWFYSKNGFKITVSGTEYLNAQLIEYYLSQIKTTLKAHFTDMYNLGVGGYKHMQTSTVTYDPATQLYFACVTCRVWWFPR
jgi:hypothetical protein